MKKTLVFTITFIFLNNVFLFSKPVEINVIKKIAVNYMYSKQVNKSCTIKDIMPEALNGVSALYIISFNEGGWVMISADDNVIPVLAYSLEGEIDKNTVRPPAFDAWIDNYKEKIKAAKDLKVIDEKVKQKWDGLLNMELLKADAPYPKGGFILLNTPKGAVVWSQNVNNSWGCTPSYNKFCPSSSGSECYCGHAPAGCAAVAMGQIMWYWQWPNVGFYIQMPPTIVTHTYDWDLMPPALYNSTPLVKGDEVAKLLHDCGEASGMTYWCVGSWTTTNKVEDGFRNSFNYKNVDKYERMNWAGENWGKLIRAELYAGRPVLYRGDKSDLSTEKHFFVCDGYDPVDNTYHFNWGWAGRSNGYFYLDDLTPGDSEFNKNQMSIIGIAPSYNNLPENIFNVPYTTVSDKKYEQAKQRIELPASGKNLYIADGGDLSLIAGGSVKLNPGFKTQVGAKFKADIQSTCIENFSISVRAWTNFFDEQGLGYEVYNANSFEFEAVDMSGRTIYQNAGTIVVNPVYVWDGTGSIPEWYTCRVTFRNNCGEKLKNDYKVYAGTIKSTGINKNGKKNMNLKDEGLKLEEPISSPFPFSIYPNPGKGIFALNTALLDKDYNIKIFDLQGKIVYQEDGIPPHPHNINLSEMAKGSYIIKVFTEDMVITKTLIIQ